MWKLFLQLSDGYLISMALWLVLLLMTPRVLLGFRRRWKAQPKKQKWVKLGLSLWLVCGLFTAIELGFALLYDTTDSFDMTYVSHRWFKVHVEPDLKQLAFQDGSGIDYRDDVQFPLAIPRDQQHVVFLGDSFTFGHGVPDVRNRFTNQLRAKLNQDQSTQGKFAVSNLSKPGSDLLWGEAVLDNLARDRRPVDVAAYVMCLNDIEAFHERFMDFNNEVGRLRSQPGWFLVRDTYFFNWAYFRGVLLSQSEVRNYYSFVKDYYAGEPWQKFSAALQRVARQNAERHTQFCLVIFPFLHNLGPDYPFAEVHRQIAAKCEELRIPCVDLLPALQSHAGERLTVNPFDAHPNERAHALVAEELKLKLPALLPSGAQPESE